MANQEEEQQIKIILASASPRRRELMQKAGLDFAIIAANVDESLDEDLMREPVEAAKKLAERKAGAAVQALLAMPEMTAGVYVVVGADTMVVCDNEIFGKPRNVEDGTRMLEALQGRTHNVHTAVSVWAVQIAEDGNVSLGFRTIVDTSDVTFKELTADQIADYLKKGESFDKAGAYAAQGEGAKLIERIDGYMDTVVGLPVQRMQAEFPDFF